MKKTPTLLVFFGALFIAGLIAGIVYYLTRNQLNADVSAVKKATTNERDLYWSGKIFKNAKSCTGEQSILQEACNAGQTIQTAKSELENYISEIEKIYQEKNSLNEADMDSLVNAITLTKSWLDTNKDADKDECNEKKYELFHTVNTILS